MEIFKGVARVIVAFVASVASLAVIFAVTLICVPFFTAFAAFDAEQARSVRRQPSSDDPVCESIDWVLDFVLRLIPDCPAPKEPT